MTSTPGLRSVADRTTSAVDLVTAEIRRGVLTGALPPGEQFSIRELARQLGVSHIPIREALRRLESQGLIILTQARSAAVAPLSVGDLEAIYRLRLRIEPDLAARSTPLQDEQRLERLRGLLEGIRDPDPDHARQAHYDFHEQLVTPAATEWDLRIMHTLWTAADRYTLLVFDFIGLDEAERDRRHERHRLLYAAAASGDAIALEAAVTAHLEFNETEIARRIRAIDQQAAPPA